MYYKENGVDLALKNPVFQILAFLFVLYPFLDESSQILRHTVDTGTDGSKLILPLYGGIQRKSPPAMV